jgi:hypothetical protein
MTSQILIPIIDSPIVFLSEWSDNHYPGSRKITILIVYVFDFLILQQQSEATAAAET